MAVPTNALQTFAMVGIREDLSDTITMISPYDTPLYSMAAKSKCKNRTPEWQRDSLRAANGSNATIEGDDVTGDSVGQPERLKNVVQLMDEVVIVSTTAEAVDAAGRKSEIGRAVAKAGKALKTDVETRVTGNYASVLGAAGTAGQMAGAEAWIETNISSGVGGSSTGWNTGTGLVEAATDGTQRAFTETLLKGVIKSCWQGGGEPSIIMVGPFNKQAASAFTGIAQQTNNIDGHNKVVIYGAADVYKSDFGVHKIVPNRFSRDRTALVLDPKTWGVAFLQPWKTEPLAKTGHSTKRLLSAEMTLICREEKANGKVADLLTS